MTNHINVNERDRAGRTPLHYSVGYSAPGNKSYMYAESPEELAEIFYRNAQYQIAESKKLIDAGADVNASDEAGYTPLHFACQHPYVETVQYLLDNGADIEAENIKGDSPLMTATSNGQQDVIRLLRNRGADPFHKDKQGFTPVSYARTIVDGSPIKDAFADLFPELERREKELQTPLHQAAEAGDGQLVAQLISSGADINARNSAGRTPLILAAWKGHVEAGRVLLEAGADVNVRDDKDEDALGRASYAALRDPKVLSLVRLLRIRGADPKRKDSQGYNALDIVKVNKNDALKAALTEPLK